MEPQGTILFSTVGLPYYGFDVFSVSLPSNLDPAVTNLTERRHTDGLSVNFNAQFVDEGQTVSFVSERSGSSKLYRSGPNSTKTAQLPAFPESLFHDRPTIRDGRLYFVSAHEKPDRWFKSWSAVYCTDLLTEKTVRLTPTGFADLSPAVSKSGNLIAVATYGSGPWSGSFRELDTDIAVFSPSAPSNRAVICRNGGWPTFAGVSTVFFHRKADDGWFSVFRLDLPENFQIAHGFAAEPKRITPPGVHAFTPAASHGGKLIAVATRRKETKYRHIEIFDLETESFIPITAGINPSFHHYNPFFSPESGHLGYHRFRGESAVGDSIAPHIVPVTSPVKSLKMLRTPMTFPSYSPDGEYIALNGNFFSSPGLMVLKSDGSKRWSLMKDPVVFYTAWSPTEKGVIYTSVGPIFESSKMTVQIARVSFDPKDLGDRDAVTATVKLLTRSDVGNNAFPSCSPDGKSLVFRSGRSGYKNLYILDAVKGEMDGGDGIRRLTEGEWIDTMPNWSPDGELIAFSSNRHKPDDPTVFSIYLIGPDGSGLRRVYVAGPEGYADVDRERINHVCFSPDSKWLLFTANFGGVSAEPVSVPNQFQPYGDLYACKLDGSGLRRLTCNAYENGTPAWHSGGGPLDVGSLSLAAVAGDTLTGQFEEPLWLSCDV